MGASNSAVECQLPKLKVAGSNPVSRSSFPSTHPLRLRLLLHRLAFLSLTLVSILGCRADPLERALRGDFLPEANNQVIFGYCQTCHIHRAFEPSAHLGLVRALYDRAPYTTASECRACHLVAEDTWNVKHRKTIFPADVVQNRYTAHERRFLKQQAESSTGRK